ncbi:hypothetical protein CONCODRAFT_7254 [Conidiobolus coronatus NRRL 28638]|uniref:GATA-type domain-containing protein n=1 Tax=Conidiobolus coronatus (strain ATCC 28846 / CBS 209.66 / NRRL 28638) TaxID=796925 RepID=A0A137P5C7_CONC2|nr:hypothetical protein CONCODRAFT_7254 [Conidiobolus coronatus NRRL 28638]|eukprot:KXN70220.1 hypothetical protein CONCODRAFT_7254 [Conidiobolus coronatus NRRL 28638]
MNSFTLTSDSNNSSNAGNFEYFLSTVPIYEGSEFNSSSITVANGEVFADNQLPFDPYYFDTHYLTNSSTPFPTEQCSTFNSELTNQGYHYMNIPYNPYFFANNDQIQQYLTPPVDQALQGPYFHQSPIIPNYRNKSALRKPRRRSRASKDLSASQDPKICMNCGISETPSWRRDKTNLLLLCNACGLYEKLHNKKRPVVNEKGVIKLARGKINSSGNKKSINRSVKAGEGLTKCLKCNEICKNYLGSHFCKFDYLNGKL